MQISSRVRIMWLMLSQTYLQQVSWDGFFNPARLTSWGSMSVLFSAFVCIQRDLVKANIGPAKYPHYCNLIYQAWP